MQDEGVTNDLDRLVGRIRTTAADAAAVTVGLGILGVNRLQVVRRALADELTSRRGDG